MRDIKLKDLFPVTYRERAEREKLIMDETSKAKKILDSVNGSRLYIKIKKKIHEIEKRYGSAAALNYIYRLELITGSRKPSLAIYDHAFHFIGGAQKYGLLMVKAIEKHFDITIISNRKVTHTNFRNWYGIDTTGFNLKVIPVNYFEKAGTFHIEPHRITRNVKNPFHVISRESGMYDFFINNSMLEMVYPLSLVSIIVCHFPERRPVSYFYSDIYTYTVFNSLYTKKWIEKRWKYTPHKHIYPPVDMSPKKQNTLKKKIILSVARFEEGGTKKQLEMVENFIKMVKIYPGDMKGWKFVLAGGSPENNPYLKKIEGLVKSEQDIPIEIWVNISDEELRKLYKDASIFWHICGLGQDDPAKVEHFGMTIAEAMQNGIVPVVFDGGGQREIVDHGKNGFRVNSKSALIQYTIDLIKDPVKRNRLGTEAVKKSNLYDLVSFKKKVSDFFMEILSQSLEIKLDKQVK